MCVCCVRYSANVGASEYACTLLWNRNGKEDKKKTEDERKERVKRKNRSQFRLKSTLVCVRAHTYMSTMAFVISGIEPERTWICQHEKLWPESCNTFLCQHAHTIFFLLLLSIIVWHTHTHTHTHEGARAYSFRPGRKGEREGSEIDFRVKSPCAFLLLSYSLRKSNAKTFNTHFNTI